jgi:hypothetical protein
MVYISIIGPSIESVEILEMSSTVYMNQSKEPLEENRII